MPDAIPVALTADLQKAFKDPSAGVRKAALQIISAEPKNLFVQGTKFKDGALAALSDTDARVRLAAILAVGAISEKDGATEHADAADNSQISQALLSIYPELHDPWMESAVVFVKDLFEAAADSPSAVLQLRLRPSGS